MSSSSEMRSEETCVLDDGKFYIVVVKSAGQREEDASAFLLMRETRGGKDPCVGSAILELDGVWNTRITVTYDEVSESDSVHVGDFDSRVEAIVLMWRRRHESSYFHAQ
ncbi:hypothetical protein [Delftia sp. HK171]|uniref:hypothetical protein n=1 Tax=Delftia sp. HK171 TaxID=1920191 RepID=UPI001153ACA0|nr:hypothetical protein [Delftia sp. HK171]TQL81141.1 hypothetical protein FB549_2696 [Delftia sp. HK171]